MRGNGCGRCRPFPSRARPVRLNRLELSGFVVRAASIVTRRAGSRTKGRLRGTGGVDPFTSGAITISCSIATDGNGALDRSSWADSSTPPACRAGSSVKPRPIPKAMTVTVILAGLLPIMWGAGTGSEVMQRIAAPMVGGMITAPLLSMLVIPAAYFLLRRRESRQVHN